MRRTNLWRGASLYGIAAATFCLLWSALSVASAAAATAGVPGAVSGVSIAASETNTTLTVQWTPSAAGVPADFYVAQAYNGTRYAAQAWCMLPSCTTVSIPGLPAGKAYTVVVYPGNRSGYGAAATSKPLTLNACTNAGLCAMVNALAPTGPATLRAQGFLDGTGMASDESAVLRPRLWRMGVNPPNYTLFNSARAAGAKVMAIVSDAWLAKTYTPSTGFAQPPWQDWTAYRSWVRAYATDLVSSGHSPDYWDVQNEPGFPGYLSPLDSSQWTVDRMLEQFNVAYTEIRAVDPNAKVVGPSTAPFTVVPRPMVLDLRTFLGYAQSKGFTLGAIAWHETDVVNRDGDTAALPVSVKYHVDTVRKLLATHNVGRPEIIVGEFGPQQLHQVPGWTVGYLANLESANVDLAGRTCWNAGYPAYNECTNRSADGLFSGDGSQRLASYWVSRFYASMLGNRVATRTSGANFSTYATTDASGVVRVLVGRHEQCTQLVPFGCIWTGLTSPGPQTASIDVIAPTGVARWHVTVSRMADAPTTLFDGTVSTNAGWVHVGLSALNDGDAVTVTMTPAA